MNLQIVDVTININDSNEGRVSAQELLDKMCIPVSAGTKIEIDRKRLYEDNEGFEVLEVNEVVEYNRTGADTLPLTVIISIHPPL